MLNILNSSLKANFYLNYEEIFDAISLKKREKKTKKMSLKEISEQLAEETLNSDPNRPVAIDIDTVRGIADIIFELIERCRERREAAAVVERIDSPTFIQEIAVKRQVRRSLSRREYRSYGRELTQKMLLKAASSSKEDIQELVEEVDGAI